MSADTAYRADIDGLRAVSVLAVVLYHAGIDHVAGGYVGVDVFFVISGFLITGQLLREVEGSGTVALGRFYARRIRRLLPLTALTIATTLTFALWALPPTVRGSAAADARSAALYVANWRFADQTTTYSDTEVTEGLFVHFWSLSIEEQFYVLWPLLILFGAAIARRTFRSVRSVAGGLLAVVVAASLAAGVVATASDGAAAYFPTHTRLWELGIGAGLAVVAPLVPAPGVRAATALSITGLVAVVGAAVTFDAETAFPGVAALVPVGGAVALLVAGTGGGPVSGLLGQRPACLVGRLSYAWYLWHWPAIGAALILYERWDLEPIGEGPVVAVAVVVSFGVAWASHVLVENPIRFARTLRDRLRPNLALAALAMVVPVAIGVVGLQIVDRGEGPIEVAGASAPMSPSQARDDRPAVGSHCHLGFGATTIPDDCVFGDPNAEFTVAVLGDSHARHWVPAFDALGAERGWRVEAWTKSACVPVDVAIYDRARSKVYDECATWRGVVEERIAARDDVDVVIIARSGRQATKLVDDGAVVEDPERVAELWADGVRRSIAAYSTSGAEVVLFADTPWPGFDVPGCLAEHLSDPQACGYAASAARIDTDVVAVETAIAAQLGARVVDPFSIVCRDATCEVFTADGTVVFYDSHHLTQTFARSVRDALVPFVTPSAAIARESEPPEMPSADASPATPPPRGDEPAAPA